MQLLNPCAVSAAPGFGNEVIEWADLSAIRALDLAVPHGNSRLVHSTIQREEVGLNHRGSGVHLRVSVCTHGKLLRLVGTRINLSLVGDWHLPNLFVLCIIA